VGSRKGGIAVTSGAEKIIWDNVDVTVEQFLGESTDERGKALVRMLYGYAGEIRSAIDNGTEEQATAEVLKTTMKDCGLVVTLISHADLLGHRPVTYWTNLSHGRLTQHLVEKKARPITERVKVPEERYASGMG
jgi:hypothetical protein